MHSHENTRTSDVMAPSHGSKNSTLTDFEFDDDPHMSPRPVNNNYASRFRNPRAQKNYEQEDDLDYAINTSALHNALPEFSDGRSVEEEDDEEDISIEIGRGRKTSYRMDDSRDSLLSLDDSRLTASLVDGRDELRQSKTGASKSTLRNISNRSALRKGDALRKDAQIRRASLLAQKEGLDTRLPKARRTSDGALQPQRQQRRTLADMHAKVSEVYDGSYLGDERPSSPHVTTRNTRFGTAKAFDQENISRAVRRAAGYVEESVEYGSRRQQRNNTESFLLPDVENLSELVSGIYQDGIPVNARQTRPRTTRFTSPPAVEIPEDETEQHVRFDGVPIPEDEKAIFNSLRLLQRKVSALEKDNADVEGKLEELRQENTILRAEQLRRQRRVSGGDEEEVARGGAATLAVERNRLEAANLALREQLEAANCKVSDHESSVERMKQERNSVVNELGTVYLSCQELKSENEALQQENDELKVQLAILMSGKRKTQRDDGGQAKEQTRTKRSITETRPEFVDDMQQTSRDRPQKPTADMPTLDERAQELLNQTKDNNYHALFSLGLPSRRAEPKEPKEQGILKKDSKSDRKQPNIRKQRSKRPIIDLEDGTEYETTMDTREIQTQTVSQDLTYLSFVDSREIAQLRKTLEEERIARKNRRSHGVSGQDKFRSRLESFTRDFTKASFKDTTRRSLKSAVDPTNHGQNLDVTEGNEDATTEQRDPTAHQEDLTRASSRCGSRPEEAGAEDMTSAFILPDITMHGVNLTAAANGKEEIQLPPSAQRILDQAVRHERGNCTVCKKGTPCTNAGDPQPITIPQPQPVSERPTEQPNENVPQNLTTNIDENDHTMRPSQPPSMALAKVLKSLEDELAHLKMQLAVCQSRYSRHDAAVGRRNRVKLGEQMMALMGEIESKSEVVYALYDVLEGQKGDGEDKEKEKDKTRQGESDEEDEELPWEGFESTQDDFTGRSGMSRKVFNV